jgi:ubiquinone/menaquinone biosynthesis C-methylase UbiE
MNSITDRQQREVEYHKGHAATLEGSATVAKFDVVETPRRRWWNAYWSVWTFLRSLEIQDKKVLVVGCGAGADALLFAKLGATVFAFDLSPDMLSLAIRAAERNDLSIRFDQMPAERMSYASDTFDIVFARDILHHVDIPMTMQEVMRVAKPDALLVIDEVYSHSVTDWVRRSWFVERLLYPAMQTFIYKGEKPYITADERKMNESDIAQVTSRLGVIRHRKYFNFLVARIFPDRFSLAAKLDRIALLLSGPLGRFLGGRIWIAGDLRK